MPGRIAEILLLVRVLTAYGRHLADTIEHGTVWRGFATVAQFFGTANLAVIVPHIHRGIMRAVALERVLLERAKHGRDLVILAPRVRASRTPQPAAAPQPDRGPQPADAPPAAKPARRPARTLADELLTFDNMPTMAQLEAEARRRPFGRTLVEICRDLGISPGLCTGPFWNQLFAAIRSYRGSLGNVVLEMRRREKQLDKDSWKYPKLGLPEYTREGIQRALGFLIGEPPVDAFRPTPPVIAPIVAAATGPP